MVAPSTSEVSLLHLLDLFLCFLTLFSFRHFEDRRNWWTFEQKAEIMRWFLTLLVGMLCGFIALGVTFGTKVLTTWKYDFFNHLVNQETLSRVPFGTSYLFLLSVHLSFAFLSVCTVFIEPSVAGSGIPEIKCYLNGLNIPGLIKVRTLFLKAIGIIFACAAGLPLGKEGPMVHIGAILAAEISQGTFLCQLNYSKFQDFRNDREKRDFVACGTAAGVSAAFGAPIGGVLFSLEEGASYWSTKLTWRSFFCAMTTVFSLYALNTANRSFGHSDITAMFSFGEFFSLQGEESNYSFWELSLFIIIGCFGGFIGAFFNSLTQVIGKFRRESLSMKKSRKVQLIIVLMITAIMTSFACFLPILYERCTPLPMDMDGWGDQEKSLVSHLIPYYCPNKEMEYNELASLYLTDSDTSIRQLFHFREVGDQRHDHTFTSGVLLLFFLPYVTMSCVTYGTAIPAGMFVPSLLAGAAFGRMIGHLLHKIDGARGTFADSGTYALIGAASICSGISRMTISLTVMILEATGDLQYVLPLMLTILMARLIGNMFSEGIYDMQIHHNKMNYLEEEEELSKISEWHDLLVSDVMTPSPLCLNTFLKVGECYEVLKQKKHYCYPIGK
jgi:chloride channel 7